MSRQAKIIIFGLILGYSIYSHQNDLSILDVFKDAKENNLRSRNSDSNKNNNSYDDVESDYPNVYRLKDQTLTVADKDLKSFKEKYPNAINISYASRNYSYPIWENEESNKTQSNQIFVWNGNEYTFKELQEAARQSDMNLNDYLKKMETKGLKKINEPGNTRSIPIRENEETRKSTPASKNKNKFNIDDIDYLAVPQTGSSPYDSYFGKGVYNETDNYIEVKAPTDTHVVFILINSNTNRRIRNEFIRKGETFKMTKIPYGTYDYMYFTGRNWSNNLTINNGKVKGAFKDYPSFNRNKYQTDQMEFERGYYGGYEIKLVQSVGGNLETQSTSENNFFN